MKIETVALEDQQTRITAEFDAEIMEKYKRQAARKISQSTKVPGFRPGKAPFDLIRRMVGDEALAQEAIEIMLEDVYPQILTEAAITPSGPGKLEEIISMDPPRFAFIVPLAPTVELGDYKAIRKDYAPEPITDEQIEQTLLRLRRSYAVTEPVERAAEAGDQLTFTLSATHKDPGEGENETLLEATSYQMVAGEQNENDEDWPYEGFTNELIGMTADDTKTVEHTFAEDSRYEELRGKTAVYTIKVSNVKSMTLPELNDEFAQTLGEFETVDALRSAISQQLEQNYTQQYEQNYYDELIETLVSQATVKYPPHLLEDEIDQFVHNVEHSLEHDHLDLDTYLKMREMDRETFLAQEVRPAAEKRLLRSLVLEEFARQENVEVKRNEIQSVYQAALQQMQQSKELRQAQTRNRQSSSDMANSIAMNTINSIFNQRMTARLRAIATGKGDEVAVDLATTPMDVLVTEQAALDEAETPMPETAAAANAVAEETAAVADNAVAAVEDAEAKEPAAAEEPAGAEEVDTHSTAESAAEVDTETAGTESAGDEETDKAA